MEKGLLMGIGVTHNVLTLPSSSVSLKSLQFKSVESVSCSSGMGADVINSIDGSVNFKVGTVAISLSGLAIAAIVGIILNALFPDKDKVQSINEDIEK